MRTANDIGRATPPPVTLINVFEVPAGRDQEFLAGWQRTAEFMRRQPGFVSTRLHVSLNEQAQFRYVNVAEWEDPGAFQKAVGQDAFREVARDIGFAEAHPSLYRVVTP
jgi:heme-degrading monooxygenase HmoA